GTIVKGDRLGHQLGFPTANIDAAGLALPPDGVYTVHAKVQGRLHRAVVNIGSRPTLRNPAPQIRVEVHLLDFGSELYGEEMEIIFRERLRGEKKFPSLDALKEQIGKDVAEARARF